jgi:hypothetical protein
LGFAGLASFFPNGEDCDADRVRNSGHGDDFYGET